MKGVFVMFENVFPEDGLKSIDFAKRVSGGNSWAGAMFRKTADPRLYAKKMIENVIREHDLVDHQIECFFNESYFIITRQEKLLIIKGYAFVEKHRQQGVHSFEDWLRELFIQKSFIMDRSVSEE